MLDDTGCEVHLVHRVDRLELVGLKVDILVWKMDNEKVNFFILPCGVRQRHKRKMSLYEYCESSVKLF